MSRRDTKHRSDGLSRRASQPGDATATRCDANDAPEQSGDVAASHDVSEPPRHGRPKCASTNLRPTATEALAVRIEFVVIKAGTPEARDLLTKQAAVVRRLMQWFADHPAHPEGHSQ
jgi:hypothetical protein